ncbi:TPM domain-containing protein [Candidatus Binatus sp.]|uniref:TPM domain-containing protein n=2 Tax=Candidatus Binatus sp. TaxID=2811406 RepID=UPI003CC6892F
MRVRAWADSATKAAHALLLLLLILASPAFPSGPKFPALTSRVVDDAGILRAATKRQLTGMLAEHERATGDQVVVVTLDSLQRYPIEEYGYELGRSWGIGQKGKNNGALLIVAPNERKVRIEVGYGLEGQLTDAKSRAIIDNYILPSFKRGDFNFGILAGATEIVRALGGNPPDEGEPTWVGEPATPQTGFGSLFHPPDRKASVALALFFLIPLIGTVLLMGAVAGSNNNLQWGSSSDHWDSAGGYRGGGSSSGGGGGGGGGGFSGGGGSFGGGGASGSW